MSRSKKTSPSFYLLGLLLLALIAGLCYMLYSASGTQYHREVAQLKLRQQAIVQARAEAVKTWLKDRTRNVEEIANNTSVKLYLTEMIDYEKLREEVVLESPLVPVAEQQYLQNYITSVATRTGMLDRHGIHANVPNQLTVSGISVFDNAGKGLVYASPAHAAAHQAVFMNYLPALQEVNNFTSTFAGFYKEDAFVAFAAPIYSVQGDATSEDRLGFAFAMLPVASQVEGLLHKPDTFEKSAITILANVDESDALEFYNMDNVRELSAGEAARMVEYLSIMDSGNFIVAPDHAGTESLAIALPVEGLPWYLVHKVDSKESLAPIKKQRRLFLTTGLLALASVLLITVAAWRHGSSLRFKKLATAFQRQSNLVRLVTDNQPNSMYIVDNQQRYCFANKEAASFSSIDAEQMIGKQVRHVMGPKASEELSGLIAQMGKRKKPIMHIHKEMQNDNERVLQSRYIPVKNVPLLHQPPGSTTPGVLVVEQDITDAIAAREKNERILHNLVDAIVGVVDSRDNHMANQSIMVSRLAEGVAKELKLNAIAVDTVSIAAKLMNVGKISLPRELLQKKGKLTAKEHKQITEALSASADFVKDIEFSGPVYETLRQMQERVDGTGPLKKKEKTILQEAQIVAACNAYVAMTSDRAYRKGMDHAKASDILMSEIGSKFSRPVIVALINYLDNAGHLPGLKG